MAVDEWKETRREFSIGPNGELIPVKITQEPKSRWERKDYLDLIFRSIAALALAVPFLLFYFQRNAETKKQSQLYQLDLYTSCSVELHKIAKSSFSSLDYALSKNKLFIEIYPKLLLFNNPSIVKAIDTLQNELLVKEFYDSTATNQSKILGGFSKRDDPYYLQDFRGIANEYRRGNLSIVKALNDTIKTSYIFDLSVVKVRNSILDSFTIQLSTYLTRRDSAAKLLDIILFDVMLSTDEDFNYSNVDHVFDDFSALGRFWDEINKNHVHYISKRVWEITTHVDSLIRKSNSYLSYEE